MQMIEPYKSKEGTLLISDGISWIVFSCDYEILMLYIFSDGLSMITTNISTLFTEISHQYNSSMFFIGELTSSTN